jgi:DNA-binding NtrC family response regulator
MDARARILVVDDDPDVLVAAQLLLKRHFAEVMAEADPDRLPGLIAAERFDAILLDMNFTAGADSGGEGLRWLGRILELDGQAAVVLMTAYGDVDTAVRTIKQGACDFVLKPWENQKLVATVHAAVQLSQSRREVRRLETRQRALVQGMEPAAGGMIGQCEGIRRVHTLIRKAAPTDANVLVLGDNGTGKELVAREIHRQSGRSGEPFIAVDLGAISETLFESELFGHTRGAFTDAHKDRIGRFQIASGGTLFLDEIGNLPMHLQGKLLSALELRQVLPVGSNRPLPIDVRLVSATNRPLARMVADGTFREDLLYRINTVEVHLPPLAERGDDIPLLLEHFLQRYTHKYGLGRKRISAAGLAHLQSYAWPGNVRELSHAVERALILSEGDTLGAEDFLLSRPAASGSAPGPAPGAADDLGLDELNLDQVEKVVVRRVLLKHDGNISRAARELGITRTSLYRRMSKYGL